MPLPILPSWYKARITCPLHPSSHLSLAFCPCSGIEDGTGLPQRKAPCTQRHHIGAGQSDTAHGAAAGAPAAAAAAAATISLSGGTPRAASAASAAASTTALVLARSAFSRSCSGTMGLSAGPRSKEVGGGTAKPAAVICSRTVGTPYADALGSGRGCRSCGLVRRGRGVTGFTRAATSSAESATIAREGVGAGAAAGVAAGIGSAGGGGATASTGAASATSAGSTGAGGSGTGAGCDAAATGAGGTGAATGAAAAGAAAVGAAAARDGRGVGSTDGGEGALARRGGESEGPNT